MIFEGIISYEKSVFSPGATSLIWQRRYSSRTGLVGQGTIAHQYLKYSDFIKSTLRYLSTAIFCLHHDLVEKSQLYRFFSTSILWCNYADHWRTSVTAH